MAAVLAPFDAVEAEAPAVPFEPGIRTDLPHEDYLKIAALSASGIKRVLQSPMHYRYDQDNPSEPTDSMLIGTALHMAVLEPDRFAADLLVIPDDAPKRPTAVQRRALKPSPAALESIRFWSDFEASAQGKLVLNAEQLAQVRGMAGAVQRHPAHGELLRDGAAEVSMQWRDARLDIPCKARFDYLRDDGIAIDVKSCVDASPEGFARAVTSFKYHYQNAWYNTAHEHLRDASLRAFVFIAVENTAPYGCAAYVIEPNAIAFGARRCEDAMLLYKQSLDTGYWRSYPERVQPIVLPRWATSFATPSY
jgi:exodeoxyribonuclease VIII